MTMTDNYGRKIEYLRMSVTENCNLRCGYCMPEDECGECRCGKVLNNDELVKIASAAAELGMKKLRITGGEPLVRRDLTELVKSLSQIPGIEDLSLTTNGTLLAPKAQELYSAGIHRINISLDTLDPEKYARITRGGKLSDAVNGIRAALEVGMSPVKLNTVLIGGFNDDEIESLCLLTMRYPVELRFIELMPIGHASPFGSEAYISNNIVLEKMPELVPIERQAHSVARLYKLPGAVGKVGLISPLSNHFCSECNRLRLTADGHLKPCLHSAEEINVRGLTGDDLKAAILSAVAHKPRMHVALSATEHSESKRSMYRIGG